MMMVHFLVCLNSFFCGAICMLIALTIQPEVVQMMRKIYSVDFDAKRKADEWNECLLVYYQKIDDHLHKLYGMTREQCADEMDETMGDLWADIDEYMMCLKELISDDKEKKD